MYRKFIAHLKSNRIILSADQKILAEAILKVLESYPEMLQARSGKTWLFKHIDSFLDTLSHAEAVRPR